jgi:hypothetical protein
MIEREREKKRTNEPFNMKYCDFFFSLMWKSAERILLNVVLCWICAIVTSHIIIISDMLQTDEGLKLQPSMFRFYWVLTKNSQNNFFFLSLWLHDMANVWSIWEVGMRKSFSHNLVYLLQRRRIFLTLSALFLLSLSLSLSHSILLDSFCSNHQQR